MARKKSTTKEKVECTTLRANRIELVDKQGGVCALTEVSPISGKPAISLWDGISSNGISLSVGGNGQASIGTTGNNSLRAGFSSFADGRSALFVYDNEGREVFVAGIDMNGERFIRLMGPKGNIIWEVKEEHKENSKRP